MGPRLCSLVSDDDERSPILECHTQLEMDRRRQTMFLTSSCVRRETSEGEFEATKKKTAATRTDLSIHGLLLASHREKSDASRLQRISTGPQVTRLAGCSSCLTKSTKMTERRVSWWVVFLRFGLEPRPLSKIALLLTITYRTISTQ
jgi:hypothetical protein